MKGLNCGYIDMFDKWLASFLSFMEKLALKFR